MTKKKEREVDILEQKAIGEEVREELTEIEKPGIVKRVRKLIKKVRKQKNA